MTQKIRFHLDEHIHPAIARELRRRGIDVTTTVEVNLRTTSDETQLEFAKREKRVLVTQDDDFLAIASRDISHAGIAYCHQESRTIGQIIEMLMLIYEVYQPEELYNKVEFL